MVGARFFILCTLTRIDRVRGLGASWRKAVEGFFAKLTERQLKRGVFRPSRGPKGRHPLFLVDTKPDPKPFTWIKHPPMKMWLIREQAKSEKSLDRGVLHGVTVKAVHNAG